MLRNLSILRLCVIFSIACHRIGYTTVLEGAGANAEDILCRMCGEEISNIKYAHNRLSPDSIQVKNQTDFSKNGVFVQVLANPVGMKFKLMTLFKSSCSGHGSWHGDHSWFPGFAWKICLCPRCHKHLGWIFEPADSAKNSLEKASLEGFYGLNVNALVSPKAASLLIHSVEL